MSKRTFISTEQRVEAYHLDQLPTDVPVAIYYRQSTVAQIGNISTSMQTIDLKAEMLRRGWDKDNILLIDMDAGISGMTKIDERVGMKQLFELISTGQVGAVACQDEDRLFRDVTQIQVNIFIDVCLRKRVQVITPSIVYVFHHPTMGEFFKKQFRFKSEMAAEYLNFLRGRLGGARDRLRREGKYAGGRVPLGFMVDARKDSPTYKRYVCWPLYANLVRQAFEAFVASGGHSYTTAHQLRLNGVKFPDPETTLPPKGFAFTNRGLNPTGYLSATTIRNMVTNPVYIGHWMYKGVIAVWDNHEALVDDALFFRAFNFLSPVSFDGQPNSDYHPTTERIPRLNPIDPTKERPLLIGMLFLYDGDWRKLGGDWEHKHGYYSYVSRSATKEWKRQANPIDEAVLYHLFEHVRQEYNSEQFTQAMQKNLTALNAEIEGIQERILSLEYEIARQTRNLGLFEDKQTIHDVEKLRRGNIEELSRAQAKLRPLLAKRQKNQVMMPPDQQTFREALDSWDVGTRDEKRSFIAQFIHRVEIPAWQGNTFDLLIYWNDETISRCEVWRRRPASGWTYAQQILLMELIAQDASKEAVLAALPDKTWNAIRRTLRKFQPKAQIPRTVQPNAVWKTRWEQVNDDSPQST